MRKRKQRVLIAVTVLLSFFACINIHEIGHVVAARLLGASDATYALYTRTDVGFAIGYYVYDPSQISPLAAAVVTVAGLLFSQATAVILLAFRGVWVRSWFKREVTAVAALVFFLDAPWQVWQGVVTNIHRHGGETGKDLVNFIYLINRELDINITLLKAGWLLLLALHTLLLFRLYRIGDDKTTFP